MPATPARQRLVVALLAVITTVVVGLALIGPHLAFLRRQADAAAPKPCAAGQTQGCIGGTMPVIVLPPGPAPQGPPSGGR